MSSVKAPSTANVCTNYPNTTRAAVVTIGIALIVIAAVGTSGHTTTALTATGSVLIAGTLIPYCCRQRTAPPQKNEEPPLSDPPTINKESTPAKNKPTTFAEKYPQLFTSHAYHQAAVLACEIHNDIADNSFQQPLLVKGSPKNSVRINAIYTSLGGAFKTLPLPDRSQSPFKQAGIGVDSRILQVNSNPVSTIQEFLTECHAYIDSQSEVQAWEKLPAVDMLIVQRNTGAEGDIKAEDAVTVNVDISNLAHWRNSYAQG